MVSFGLIIFFIALVSAWYLGYRTKRESSVKQRFHLPKDYLIGLNYLLNEEPDKAVDVFIKMLEVDSNTVETHLAVGKLFRRRGEVDRAIRIHQNLIARPQLDRNYREQALFELGQDYLSAGVLDRAERIFLEVINVKEYSTLALGALLDIYQQEKDWKNAVKIAYKIEVATSKNMQPVIAHYYCELAKEAYSRSHYEETLEHIRHAFEADDKCVRASLLHAQAEIDRGEYKSALRSLHRVKDQNPDYLSKAITQLAVCYLALEQDQKFINYLMKLAEDHPHIPLMLLVSDHIRRLQGDKIAAECVADYVRRYPSIQGLHAYINLYIAKVEGRVREDLLILQNLTKKLLTEKPDYQCTSCGFSGKSLHWQCPGCKQWNTTKPLHSIALA